MASISFAVLLMVVEAQVLCDNATSISLTVHWPDQPNTDLYAVYLATSETDPPFAMRTSASSSLLVDDLLPEHTYFVSVRSHPANLPTIAWGPAWTPYLPWVKCTTTKEEAAAPRGLRRVGKLEPFAIDIAWTDAGPIEVGIRRALELVDFEWRVAQGSSFSVIGLEPHTEYEVTVRRMGHERWAHPVRMRTRSADSVYTLAYRISEYSFDVDFLENHDAATVDAMPVYLMTCDQDGNCSPWNVTDVMPKGFDWDECQKQLAVICPGQRGVGFPCLECEKSNRAQVTAACGEWSDQDELKGFPVHWYCGLGWPESVASRGPMTEYCVEHTPAPVQSGVYANYLSCNSDEVEAWFMNTTAKDPLCICECWNDRGLGHQTIPELNADCGPNVYPGWNFTELVCNCSGTKSPVPNDDNPSSWFVGRGPIYLPYVGCTYIPAYNYTNIPSGDNLSFPKRGSCGETQQLGDPSPYSGKPCRWKREHRSRLLYGADLIAAGWNMTFVPDTPTDVSHTLANVGSFKKALDNLNQLMSPRCCGC